MSGKWTKGPWSLWPYGVVIGPDGHPLKCVSPWQEGAWDGDAEAVANARVWSASLDLMEALVAAREVILSLKNARWSEVEGSDSDWVGFIDAALLKATGE